MASPPFNINQSLPGDSDIVSQHPPNARTFRDIVESWLLINHDTNGNHARVDIPRSASPSTPAASVDVLYVTTRGRLKIKHPDGTEEFVGVPPGHMSHNANAVVPVGWLYANGASVSRATYPDLFDTIGTTYGTVDVNSFNLPDWRGRASISIDDSSGRISVATMSSVSVGGTGGNELSNLVANNIPSGVSVNVTGISTPTIAVSVNGTISGSATGSTASGSISGTASGGAVTGTATGTVSGTAAVNSTLSTFVKNTATFVSQTTFGGGVLGLFSDVTALSIGGVASTGTISGSISGTSLAGSLTSAASVTGSFSGAAVSAGTVTGTFSGSGTGTGSGGTGTGVTTGTSPGTAFSNMIPAIVFYPLIKT